MATGAIITGTKYAVLKKVAPFEALNIR